MSAFPLHTVTPRRLVRAREIDAQLPESLEARGVFEEAELAVAIVGARAAYESDLATAAELGAAVARRGGVVISGGAIGVDAAAHRGALAAGGRTVAVLGTGVDILYPQRHRGLFAQMTVVSQFERGARPLPWRFVARNSVIAALADLVIVVGATARSGALHTAAAAVRLRRLLAAAPGADGCDRLLARGAALVETSLDLACCLAGAPNTMPGPELPVEGSPDRRVFDVVEDRPTEIEELADRAGMPLREAQRVLASLELAGLVRAAPGQTYQRTL